MVVRSKEQRNRITMHVSPVSGSVYSRPEYVICNAPLCEMRAEISLTCPSCNLVAYAETTSRISFIFDATYLTINVPGIRSCIDPFLL